VLLLAEWALGSRGRRFVTQVMLGAALLLAFPFHPPRLLWWIVVYVLTAALLWRPVSRLADRRTASAAGAAVSARVLTS